MLNDQCEEKTSPLNIVKTFRHVFGDRHERTEEQLDKHSAGEINRTHTDADSERL